MSKPSRVWTEVERTQGVPCGTLQSFHEIAIKPPGKPVAIIEHDIFEISLCVRINDKAVSLRYVPKRDITAYETAMLTQLLFGLMAGAISADWGRYLIDHGLQRHFEPIDQPQATRS